jgi:DNA-binding protein H-NS
MAKQNLTSMSVDALLSLRDQVTQALAVKGDELRRQISRLGIAPAAVGKRNTRGRKAEIGSHALKGRKVASKYCSKQDRKLTWSGRGAMPRWMTAEIKGTKLKKEDFLI